MKRNDMIKKTLSNGVPVYFYIDKNMKRIVASYNVNYGSNGYYERFIYKDKEYHVQPGMAHFLEHYLIEHSKFGNMLHRYFDRKLDANGLTYMELTSYYFVGVDLDDMHESLKELVEFIDDPVFTEEAVEETKSAIVDELRRGDDNKYGIGFNLNRRNLYSSYEAIHESGNRLGTKETTLSITLEDAKVCYDAYYNNDNKFMVIGGNIDIDEYIEYLESVIKDLPKHENHLKEYDYGDVDSLRTEYDEIEKDIENNFVIATYKVKNDYDIGWSLEDLYLYLFMRLKFAPDTKFVTDLINDHIIYGGIGWSTDFFRDYFTITFSADVLDKDVFLERLENELKDVDFDSKLFELLKRNMVADELSKLDFVYRSLLRYPGGVLFSESLFNLDTLEKCTIDGTKEFISKLDLSKKTIMYMKRKN